MRTLSELPPQYKAAVYLADIHGYQSHEIAQMLGTPLGTVSSRIHRGRQMLRARIGRSLSPASPARQSPARQPMVPAA
jgi:DNA-directed RNA polymerase specialized sigma24 family protein